MQDKRMQEPSKQMADIYNIKWEKKALYEVARWQRYIMWVILVMFLVAPIVMFIPYAHLPASVLLVYFMYRMAKAVKSSYAWAYIVLALIPWIGLVALLYLNLKATKILRDNGIKVGLMGAKSKDYEMIKWALFDEERQKKRQDQAHETAA